MLVGSLVHRFGSSSRSNKVVISTIECGVEGRIDWLTGRILQEINSRYAFDLAY